MKNKVSQNEYRTGSHIHQRSYGALFAVGIFLFLTVTGMLLTAALLNLRVRTSRSHKVIAALEPPAETVSLNNDLHMEGVVMHFFELGITGQSISEFCKQYYELPTGIYIVSVQGHAPTALHGVLPGDILTKANKESLHSPTVLQNIINQCPVGEFVELEFVRQGKTYTVYFTPEA